MRFFASLFVGLAAVLSPAALSRVAALESEEIPEEQKTVQITLYPAAEPRPALKYQLLPPFIERRPGNAAVWWNRLPAERDDYFQKFDEEYSEPGKIDAWQKLPLGSPEEKAYREKELEKVIYLLRPGGLYSDMERAARFESCDWQLPIREGNVIAVCLPEVQHSRAYARILSAKAHLEIAEGKYDQAVRTLQTGYAEARHVAQGPTLVSGLVGLTIQGVMSNEVRELIQRPDAPNLYWALSTLPRPFIDMRPGAEAESSFLYLQFPELRDLEKKKLSPEEWRELLKRILEESQGILEYQDIHLSKDSCSALVALSALQGYPRAKRYLIEQGRSAAEVEAMPVAQVVLLYTVQVYNELSDDQFKWLLLPSYETVEGFARAEEHMQKALAANREIIPIGRIMLPASMSVKHAETKSEWTLAMLRIFEAMRLYAAAHDGRWPDRLNDISEVPIPNNPIDGKPFIYQRQGNKAILTSENGPRNMPWRHEITLMPKAK